MLKVAVLVSGGGTNLQALIDQIEGGNLPNVSIQAVISNNQNAYALERAKNHRIPTSVIHRKEFSTKEEFDCALLNCIDQYHVDLLVLAGCLLILPECVVEKYKNRIMNIHPSLIPAFCGEGFYGMKVHEAALARGVKVTGATVHFVDQGTDTGPIILQQPVYVREDDTAHRLQQRVMEEAEWIILPKAVKLFAEGRITVENDIVIIKDSGV